MGPSGPSEPNPGNGGQPDDRPQQVAQPSDQQELPPQEMAVSLQVPPSSHFKSFPKPSVLQVEACMLENVFGPNGALLPAFQEEFKVMVQTGEPDPEGKVEVRITGSPWYRMRAKKIIYVLNEKFKRKRRRDSGAQPGNHEVP